MGVVSSAASGFDTSVTMIPEGTAADTSEDFQVPEGCAMTFFSDILSGTETVKVQIKKPDGTYLDVSSGGAPVQLDSSSNTEALYAKGVYRLSKSVTASAVGVYAFGKPFRTC